MTEAKTKQKSNHGKVSLKLENPKILKNVIETLASIIDETKITFYKDGLFIRAMDPSRICLLEFKMKEADFDAYECSSKMDICLNLDDLDKIMKRSASSDKIEIVYLENDNKIKIILTREGSTRSRTFSLAILDVDIEKIKMEKLLEIEYNATWILDSEIITEAIKDAEIYSEILNIKAGEKGLVFGASGQIGEMIYELTEEDLIESHIAEDNTGAYSLTFLKAIMKLSSITEKLEMSLLTDHPIKLIFNLLEGPVVHYFLAPRCEEADFDDEDMEEF
jgi:proliferating cell nuclear antigen